MTSWPFVGDRVRFGTLRRHHVTALTLTSGIQPTDTTFIVIRMHLIEYWGVSKKNESFRHITISAWNDADVRVSVLTNKAV